ncbi:MAG: NAD-dependent DNA ligase LigA [Opitutaceae bacterium]|nr:NAD-dependent DNA ligase LigA [Opitutaceae bacterium]
MKARFVFLLLILLTRAVSAAETPDAAREKITVLRAEIARHDDLYHRQSTSEIPDATYDRLRRELEELERRHPDAARSVPSLAGIGDDRTGRFATRRHALPMLSLAKAYSPADLQTFHARIAGVLGRENPEYVVEPKLDGLAVSLVYEHGSLVRAVTRGNGVEGDDITANVAVISNVPRTLRLPDAGGVRPERLEVRGEIYVPLDEFARVNAEREAAGEPRFAHPRALAAGTVRQHDVAESVRRGLRVACFALGTIEPAAAAPASQRELQAALATWGLPGIPVSWPAQGRAGLDEAVEAVRRARDGFAFPSDGAVVKLNRFADQRIVGASDTAPRWAVAYKFEPERRETRVRAITLQVGRTGVLTPVAELEPVTLGGVTVARATLHNREEIARKDVRVGDMVYLERAGDVIPAIVGVDRNRRPAESRPFVFPSVCPACFAPVSREPETVAVRCTGPACPGQLRRQIEHYASQRALDIEGLGPAMVDILVGQGWVTAIPDLYRLRRADLLSLGRDNERSVDQLLAAIERSKRAELWRVIHGLGIPQVGVTTAKDLALRCGSLPGLAEKGPEWVAVLAEPRYQDLIAELVRLGVAATSPSPAATTLRGKTFVLTGTLPTLSRVQATEKIEAAGGRVASSVSRSTDYVVVGAEPGAKLDRARAFGVPLLDEAELRRMLERK